MFDQIEGLRWVNKFIKYFGGDPNAVTVVGESAGAASASFLMLAPQARGIILQYLLNKWLTNFKILQKL
jgi:carboxylesterase type B